MQTLKEKLEEIAGDMLLQNRRKVSIDEAVQEITTLFQEEIEKCVPEKFERQYMGDRWDLAEGGHVTMYYQTESEVDYFNSCRENLLQNLKAAGLTK
jgi:hypothetical protein